MWGGREEGLQENRKSKESHGLNATEEGEGSTAGIEEYHKKGFAGGEGIRTLGTAQGKLQPTSVWGKKKGKGPQSGACPGGVRGIRRFEKGPEKAALDGPMGTREKI